MPFLPKSQLDSQQLFDGSHVLSLDAESRTLNSSFGTPHVNWNTEFSLQSTQAEPVSLVIRKFEDDYSALLISDSRAATLGAGFLTITDVAGDNVFEVGYTNRVAINGVPLWVDSIANYTNDSLANIDLLNRKLYAEDGTTEVMGYSSVGGVGDGVYFFPSAIDGGANIFLDSNNNSVLNLGAIGLSSVGNNSWTVDPNDSSSGLLSVGRISTNQIRDGAGVLAIDLNDHKLYNPDGTTLAVDYGTNGAVHIGGIFGGAVAAVNTQYEATGGPTGGTRTTVSMGVGSGNFYIRDDEGVFSAFFEGLPTSDPHVANQLWKNGTVLNISNG